MKSEPRLYVSLFAFGTCLSDLEATGQNWLFNSIRNLSFWKSVVRNVTLGAIAMFYLSIREMHHDKKTSIPKSLITGTNTYPTVFTFWCSFPYNVSNFIGTLALITLCFVSPGV